MAWQKQVKFKSGKRIEDDEIKKKSNYNYIPKNKEEAPKEETQETSFVQAPIQKTSKFLQDWQGCRDRHPGQITVLQAIFDEKCQYVFYRAGRKGAKTTTGIDIAWRIAHEQPNRVIYLCYPTIAQGIEVVWEERRLQTCDQKNDSMFEKYVEKVDDSRHIVRFNNGSFIKLVGTWTEARGRGTQPDAIIIDEVQDCSPEYIEAMDANLAAKENAICVMMGTPPKKRNHYEDWYTRIQSHPRGKVFHFTSYENIKLPHLRQWLDNKKIELTKANKEDVWLREYMAELCYASSDRVLPDAKFLEKDEIDQKCRLFDFSSRVPILAISIHQSYFIATLSVLMPKKMIFVMDSIICNSVWNLSFSEIYPKLGSKVKELQDYCGRKIRNIVWDESESFVDVVSGFTKCREDIKWQDRGIPLLRELMVKEKIFFSREVADFGLECQNMLIDESKKDVQKNYPHVCTLAMTVNEYFAQEKVSIHQEGPFDQWQAFRDMGIPCPPKRVKNSFFNF